MSIFITSLNSGSNGNCYYIGNNIEAVLVDAGLSCREIEKRMLQLGLSMNIVKAIFISHEHTDHVKGLSTLANKYLLPVYITHGTAQHGPRLIKHLKHMSLYMWEALLLLHFRNFMTLPIRIVLLSAAMVLP